jgi:hypothetical protein
MTDSSEKSSRGGEGDIAELVWKLRSIQRMRLSFSCHFVNFFVQFFVDLLDETWNKTWLVDLIDCAPANVVDPDQGGSGSCWPGRIRIRNNWTGSGSIHLKRTSA